jgi:hypothetical protein
VEKLSTLTDTTKLRITTENVRLGGLNPLRSAETSAADRCSTNMYSINMDDMNRVTLVLFLMELIQTLVVLL